MNNNVHLCGLSCILPAPFLWHRYYICCHFIDEDMGTQVFEMTCPKMIDLDCILRYLNPKPFQKPVYHWRACLHVQLLLVTVRWTGIVKISINTGQLSVWGSMAECSRGWENWDLITILKYLFSIPTWSCCDRPFLCTFEIQINRIRVPALHPA